MTVNGVKLTNFQSNFLKELTGDQFAPDFRIEATFNKICAKYGIDATKLIEAIPPSPTPKTEAKVGGRVSEFT